MKNPSFLNLVVSSTKARLAAKKQVRPLSELKARTLLARRPLDFAAAIKTKSSHYNVIAEIKGASPSQGVLRAEFNCAELALSYKKAGAVAISVLTEPEFFHGNLEVLQKARAAVPGLPILQKDFVIDEYQIYEALESGADAILLILTILSPEEALGFRSLAKSLGLTVVVEVNTESELESALKMNAEIIAVNNRNLQTLEVSLDTSKRLKKLIRDDISTISASGIESPEDVKQLSSLGFDCFLIGTNLMRSPEPGKALSELVQCKPLVKICGLTNLEDAKLALDYGASMLGFVFAKSPRQISVPDARALIAKLPDDTKSIAIVVDESIEDISEIVQRSGVKGIQLHGSESGHFVSCLRRLLPKLFIIKAIGIGADGLEQDPGDFEAADLLLFDSKEPRSQLQSKTAARSLVRWELLKNKTLKKPFFIAGGLQKHNISEVLSSLRPYGIDISSGIETSPGKKNAEAMKSFFDTVGANHA